VQSRRPRRQGLLFILLGAVATASSCLAAPSDVPPIRSFLAIPEQTAHSLRQSLELSSKELPAGIYFTHVDEGRSRLDVAHRFTPAVPIDTRYLAEETALKSLYGEAGWRARILKRFTVQDEQPRFSSFNEFACSVRWIPFIRRDGKAARQLWAYCPGGLRWMLREENSVRSESRFFSDIPMSLIPVAHGAILISEDRSITLAFINGKSFSTFDCSFVQANVPEPKTSFRIATRREFGPWGEQIEKPLVVYSEGSHKLIFAGWAEKSIDRHQLPLDEGDAASLFMLDTDSLEVVELWRNIRWPFHLSPSGVFWGGLAEASLFHRELHWDRSTLGPKKAVPVPQNYRVEIQVGSILARNTALPRGARGSVFNLGSEGQLTPIPEDKLSPPDKDDLYRIELLGYPPDLIGRMRTGDEFTHLQFPEVNAKLNLALGAEKNTAVALIYEEGDLPRTTLTSFWWNIENHSQSVSPILRRMEHIFLFDKARFDFLKNRNPHPFSFTESLDGIHKSVLDKRSIVYFQGFPSSVEAESIGDFKTIHNRFATAAKDGRIRILYSIPRNVWGHLRTKESNLVAGITPITIGAMRESELRRVNFRAMMENAAIANNLAFNDAAFRKTLEIEEGLRLQDDDRIGSDTASIQKLINRLFAYAKSENVKGEITEVFVDKFRRHESRQYGHWKIAVFSDKNGEKAPAWVSAWSDRKQTLTPSLLKLWQAEGEFLISGDAYPHAVFHVPDGVEIDGSKLILLRPLLAPEVILRKVDVRFIRLHPDGFFVATVDDKRLKLSFFRIRSSGGVQAKGLPGELQVLNGDYLVSDFMDGTIQLRYLRGRVRVTSIEGERVFGPQGEEDPDVR
jgi:hypothetical protein